MSDAAKDFDYDSRLAYPPLQRDARLVVMSDWDKTVTLFDTNDFLTDKYGMGPDARQKVNERIESGELTLRDAYAEQMDSIDLPLEECQRILKEHVMIDEGFKDFYMWAKENDIPVIIVSSGMEPFIRAVLSTIIPDAEDIHIIAYKAELSDPSDPKSSWKVVFRHPELDHGHDKSKAILPYRELPGDRVMFFCGDGVSDLPAAEHADVLFAKELKKGEPELMDHCKENDITHVPWTNFHDVKECVQQVKEGKPFKQLLKQKADAV